MVYEFEVFKGSKDGTIKSSKVTKPDLQGDQVLLSVTGKAKFFSSIKKAREGTRC